MRVQTFIPGIALLIAGCAHDQPPGFSETDLRVYQRLARLSDSPEADLLKRFAEYWVRSLDQGKLPGLESGEHGHADTYHLTQEIQREWLKDKNVDREMFSDLGDYEDVFFVSVITTDKKYVRYFFRHQGATFALHSAYKWENSRWLKLFP
jgi:hypothetical protein